MAQKFNLNDIVSECSLSTDDDLNPFGAPPDESELQPKTSLKPKILPKPKSIKNRSPSPKNSPRNSPKSNEQQQQSPAPKPRRRFKKNTVDDPDSKPVVLSARGTGHRLKTSPTVTKDPEVPKAQEPIVVPKVEKDTPDKKKTKIKRKAPDKPPSKGKNILGKLKGRRKPPGIPKTSPRQQSESPVAQKENSPSNPFGSESEEESHGNPFGEVESDQNDDTNPFNDNSANNPFGDEDSDDQILNQVPDSIQINKNNQSKYETYDRKLNPFDEVKEETENTNPFGEDEEDNTNPFGAQSSDNEQPAPLKHKPSRPPPPTQKALDRIRSSSSEIETKSTSSGSFTLGHKKTISPKKRPPPDAPVGEKRQNDSNINIEQVEQEIEQTVSEFTAVIEEMAELEPIINQPRPSGVSQKRWEELLVKKTNLTLTKNHLQLKKDLFYSAEEHAKIEFEVRKLMAKGVRNDEEEEALDKLGGKLARIVFQKSQIEDQLECGEAGLQDGITVKSKKKGIGTLKLGKAFKGLSIKKQASKNSSKK